MFARPRRNRRFPALRALVRETELSPARLILPLFVHEGEKLATPIASMPRQSRLSLDLLLATAREAHELGIAGVALFPALGDSLKDARASESYNASGLVQRTVRALKR